MVVQVRKDILEKPFFMHVGLLVDKFWDEGVKEWKHIDMGRRHEN